MSKLLIHVTSDEILINTPVNSIPTIQYIVGDEITDNVIIRTREHEIVLIINPETQRIESVKIDGKTRKPPVAIVED